MIYCKSMRPCPWKVPARHVYCDTFRAWLAECILCHVVYRLQPPRVPAD
jgi:hypothetical protein